MNDHLIRTPVLPQLVLGLLSIAATSVAFSQGRVIRVTTATAERDRVEQTEWAVGIIETRSSVQVAAEVSGQVIKVLVDEGQGVAAGAILAELDSDEYRFDQAAEQSEVRRLETLLRQQQREVERANQLFAENLIARDQVDSIQSELDALREQLAGARTRVSESNRRLGETNLRAPVRSEVALRNIDVGDYLQVGTIAFELVDIENLRVRLPFPEYRAPEDFIARLAALVPKPRAHLIRYHGVFAPASPDRARIVPGARTGPDRPTSPVRYRPPTANGASPGPNA